MSKNTYTNRSEGKFTMIDNHMFFNKNLSFKAKGLLASLLSINKDNWEFSERGLTSLSSDGRDGINSGLKELEKEGYLIRTVKRNDSGSFIGTHYEFDGKPLGKRLTPQAENPLTVKPSLAKPLTVNTPNKELSNKELTNQQLNNNNNIVEQTPPYDQIIDYLNSTLDSQYRHTTKSTQRLINARYSEGYNLDDFKTVIDIKVDEWIDRPDMSKFLRPKTLFGTNFESYLNQPRPKQEEKFVSVYADRGMV